MTLVLGPLEDLVEDIADMTLIDEDTKSILTDYANKEVPSNTTMHVAKFLTYASCTLWWLNISNKYMWRHLLTKFTNYKVPPGVQFMVSTHGSVVLLSMFYAKVCKPKL